MKADRRDCLRVGLLAGAGSLLSGCARILQTYTAPPMPTAIALPDGPVEPAVRLLNRAGFGPTPDEVERVARLGPERFIDEQLHPDDSEDLRLTLRLRGIDALHGSPVEMRDFGDDTVLGQLQQAAILGAVYSRHPLRERMVDFWTNHFNIYGRKDWSPYFKPEEERSVIREHALGSFPEMLSSAAHSPAMLFYLDNEVNARGVPNENYARELMELHTLGVHGGYTQRDVQEVARCLTGWTVENRFLHRRGTFRFDATIHDDGPKTVLGVSIPAGGGIRDGEKVLDLLAHHPTTARFLSGKLCRYFLGTADPAWTERLAKIYLRTGGEIVPMLRPLLLSPDLIHSPPILKRPFDYVVSALRTLNANTDGRGVLDPLARMGEALYEWPMPDGYPDRTAAWTGSLLARWNFALALAANAIPGTSVDLDDLGRAAHQDGRPPADAWIEALLSRRADDPGVAPLRHAVRTSLDAAPSAGSSSLPPRGAEAVALCLASPAFQWR